MVDFVARPKLEDYKEQFKDYFHMERRNGIILLRMLPGGGHWPGHNARRSGSQTVGCLIRASVSTPHEHLHSLPVQLRELRKLDGGKSQSFVVRPRAWLVPGSCGRVLNDDGSWLRRMLVPKGEYLRCLKFARHSGVTTASGILVIFGRE